uniref:KIND domain-containing protein n=1 Tax=Neogobius melanostomus TaxID=47308 RepID=A0A8C6WRF8_9GOBI
WCHLGFSGGVAGGPAEELSLEEILKLYNQPINEEQAWAVCFQSCRTMAKGHRARPGDVRILRDGSIRVVHQICEGNTATPSHLAILTKIVLFLYN